MARPTLPTLLGVLLARSISKAPNLVNVKRNGIPADSFPHVLLSIALSRRHQGIEA